MSVHHSDSGQVAGSPYNNLPGQAFIGSPSGSTAIPFLPGWTNSQGYAINDAGQVAGYGNNAAGGIQAFIATISGSTAIPFVPGWGTSQGFAINNSGQVAGVGSPGQGGPTYQAFIGTPSSSAAIPLLQGWNYAFGAAVNNLGQVAGSVFGAASANQAFHRYRVRQHFDSLARGDDLLPGSCGVVDSGQVAGTASSMEFVLSQAFIGTTAGSTKIPPPTGADRQRRKSP